MRIRWSFPEAPVARERIRTRIRVTEQPDAGFVPAEPAPAAPTGPRWRWLVALGVLLLVVAGGVAIWSRMHAPARSPGPAPEGMVWIPSGTFWMGSPVLNLKDARPEHEVTLDGFWIDITEVTNAQFERFVNATQYTRERLDQGRAAVVHGMRHFQHVLHHDAPGNAHVFGVGAVVEQKIFAKIFLTAPAMKAAQARSGIRGNDA